MLINFDRKNNDDNEILSNHLSRYLEAVEKNMFITEAVILLCSIVIAVLVLKGFYPYVIHSHYNVPIKVYVIEQFVHKFFAWSIIASYFIIKGKLSLRGRKILLCSVSIILTTLFVYGSWNVNYFGFLFIIPIVIASPLSRKTNLVVFYICLALDAFYAILQVHLRGDRYNYLIGLVTITVLVSFYFICKSLHATMFHALLDVKQYCLLTKSLNEKVSHDYLTNAYTVGELHKDLENCQNYNSIAFLDIDNFKYTNDKYGHQMGDKVLKFLVTVIQNNEEFVYRYGGDEFVILSPLNVAELGLKLSTIKNQFTAGCDDFYNLKSTLSIGAMQLSHTANIEQSLKHCDELMYMSKHSGKNRITVENEVDITQ